MLAFLVLCLSAVALGEDISSSQEVYAVAPGCVLVRNSTVKNPPLISNGTGVIYPRTSDGSKHVVIPIGSTFTASCTPQDNSLKNYKLNQLQIKCGTNENLMISPSSEETSFEELVCSSVIKEDIDSIGTCNNNKFVNISISFKNQARQFPLISLCHDDANANTIMSQHTLYGGSIASADISNLRPSFKKSQFYSTSSPQTAYSQASQLDTMTTLVGSELANTYINSSKSLYFARGHLSPDGDFIYVAEQDATYYYVNVIPQWQSINNGNWKALEVRVRKLADRTKSTFNIYTGGYGVLTLNDANNNPVEIYLTKNGKIPAPKLTWKIIHDPAKKRAVVIIVVNNPHDMTISPKSNEYVICPDICKDIKWVDWTRDTIQKGYTYCCSVDSFRKVVTYAPYLKKVGLLV